MQPKVFDFGTADSSHSSAVLALTIETKKNKQQSGKFSNNLKGTKCPSERNQLDVHIVLHSGSLSGSEQHYGQKENFLTFLEEKERRA